MSMNWLEGTGMDHDMMEQPGLFLPKPFLDYEGADYDLYQIRVNAVAPAVVATPIYERFVPKDKPTAASWQDGTKHRKPPVRRPGIPRTGNVRA